VRSQTCAAPRFGACLAAIVVAVSAACSRSSAGAAAGAESPVATTSQVATLDLAYGKPAVVGTNVNATAIGLPIGKTVDLEWGTVTGGWVVEDYYHFRGKKYSETTTPLGRVSVDASGRVNARFVVPEDYGGVHEVIARIDGKLVAQGAINVTQTFALTPTSGPVGTPIELKVTGLGWRTMESTWVVNWDNRELGFVSAAGTRGSAVARFRATGPSGDHIVKLYTGWQGQGYLNYEQSPVAALPRPQFTFRTTPGTTRDVAYVEPYQPQSIPKPDQSTAGVRLMLTPAQGPVGTQAVVKGEGFAPGAPMRLVWETAVGSRVTETGFSPQERSMGDVTADASGRIDRTVTIPNDLGGLHGLALRLAGAGNDLVARTHFVIETSLVDVSPRSGPAGTPVTIHLKGVGWTEYDNIYVATYDNAYMGYACGFNSNGDVVINFTATGEPGAHVIDLYPGIYQGPPTEPQQLYRLPQLTYADDHPGNKIPAIRIRFDITPVPPRRAISSR
jgi:hypothetical protein